MVNSSLSRQQVQHSPYKERIKVSHDALRVSERIIAYLLVWFLGNITLVNIKPHKINDQSTHPARRAVNTLTGAEEPANWVRSNASWLNGLGRGSSQEEGSESKCELHGELLVRGVCQE